MKKIVFLGPEFAAEALRPELPSSVELLTPMPGTSEVGEAMKGAHAVLDASMKTALTDDMFAACPGMKIISCATTGSDHIDRGELDSRGISVRTLRENRDVLNNLTPAAELSWALVMACARRLVSAVEHTRQGLWDREQFPGVMLNGKCMGLVGCGRIGGWVSRYARAFGMTVLGFDPYLDELPEGVEAADLAAIAQKADVISVHVHLSDETRGLLGEDEFKLMKDGVILVNTSRGGIIDEDVLLAGLESGKVGAAGLDVLEGEPEVADHPLVKYAAANDNLLITPHCGGFSPDSVKLVCSCAMNKILKELEG